MYVKALGQMKRKQLAITAYEEDGFSFPIIA